MVSFHKSPSVFPSSFRECRIQTMMVKRWNKTKFGYFFQDDCVPFKFQSLRYLKDITLFYRSLFLTREFEAIKRLNLFQKELSLNLDLGVSDGSSLDKKVVSTFRPFLHICFWCQSIIIFKTTVKGLIRLSGEVFEIFYLFISLCKYAERKMDD